MIRDATESDLDLMVEMGLCFRGSTEYSKYLAANRMKMRELGETLLAQNGLLVAEVEGKLVGMIGFLVHDHFISGERMGGEVFWWVDPGHRGTVGIRLMREAERRVAKAGGKYMQMIAPTPEVASMYERLGYGYVESTYQREL